MAREAVSMLKWPKEPCAKMPAINACQDVGVRGHGGPDCGGALAGFEPMVADKEERCGKLARGIMLQRQQQQPRRQDFRDKHALEEQAKHGPWQVAMHEPA